MEKFLQQRLQMCLPQRTWERSFTWKCLQKQGQFDHRWAAWWLHLGQSLPVFGRHRCHSSSKQLSGSGENLGFLYSAGQSNSKLAVLVGINLKVMGSELHCLWPKAMTENQKKETKQVSNTLVSQSRRLQSCLKAGCVPLPWASKGPGAHSDHDPSHTILHRLICAIGRLWPRPWSISGTISFPCLCSQHLSVT